MPLRMGKLHQMVVIPTNQWFDLLAIKGISWKVPIVECVVEILNGRENIPGVQVGILCLAI